MRDARVTSYLASRAATLARAILAPAIAVVSGGRQGREGGGQEGKGEKGGGEKREGAGTNRQRGRLRNFQRWAASLSLAALTAAQNWSIAASTPNDFNGFGAARSITAERSLALHTR